MKWRRACAVILLVALAMGLSSAKDMAQENPSSVSAAKIEAQLADTLSASGKADFILKMGQQADLSGAYEISDWGARGRYVYDTLSQAAARSQARAKKKLQARGLKTQTFLAGNEIYVRGGDMQLVEALAQLPEVASIRAPRTYHIDETCAPAPALQSGTQAVMDWGIQDTKADQFWTAFHTQGDGIRVASIDTGVDWSHPALVNQFACPGDPTNPDCWCDPSDVCGSAEPCDNNGHGTHTMGTMVAADDPSLPYIAGMAADATWIACKGCEGSECSEFALNACADWILAPGGDPSNRPNVVNNSWGGSGGDPWYADKVEAWRAAGIFPAFSAGNEGSGCGTLGSPGDYQESFSSAAHDASRAIASFSSRGPGAFGHTPYTKPNISAPGVSICSTMPGHAWSCGYSGTSMASPHSAGAVALLWSCNPDIVGRIDQTFQILQDAADPAPAGDCSAPPDSEGNYTYGHGYLNIFTAGNAWCLGTGTLDGHVREAGTLDAPGDPLPSITVKAERLGGGARQASTDASGYYTMTLPIGSYEVTVGGDRHVPQAISDIEIVTDTLVSQDFELESKGVLSGTVTSDCRGGALDASIAFEAAAGVSYAVTTDPTTGGYGYPLEAGTYTVTVSASDHDAASVVGVAVAAGQATVRDFVLHWLPPCMEVSPLAYDIELGPDTESEQTLSIANTGATSLTWAIEELQSASGAQANVMVASATANTMSFDMPWVSEVPSDGVTPADASGAVVVIFDSSQLAAGGCYTGTLGLRHDDPGQDTPLTIPLELCVGPSRTYLPIIADHTAP